MIELLHHYDFVFYIDADAVFHDHDIRLERFLQKYPGDVIMCSDEANSADLYAVNGGAVLARKSAIPLLQVWWELRNQYTRFAFEQWAMSDIIRGEVVVDRNFHVLVAPENAFNSKYGDLVNYAKDPNSMITPNFFVLHFMAMDEQTRKNALKVEYDRIFQEERKCTSTYVT